MDALVPDEDIVDPDKPLDARLLVEKGWCVDVKAAFELEANRDLDAYFDRWIYGSSLPRRRRCGRDRGA